jgi:prolyl-tRNA synthetase
VAEALSTAQRQLLAEAQAARSSRTVPADTRADALVAADKGFVTMSWDDLGVEGEAELAAAGVTVRLLRRPDGTRAEAADEAGLEAVLARAY